MADLNPPIDPRRPPRARQYVGVSAETPVRPEPIESADPRVRITLSISDGFRFGFGFILAGIVFYAGFVVVIALAVGFALVLNLPLPFGIGGR